MNAALGLRLAAVFFAAGFLAAVFFAAGFLAAVFFAAGFFAAVFFAAGFFAAVFFAAFLAVAMTLLPVGYTGGQRLSVLKRGPPVEAQRSIGGDYTAFSLLGNGLHGEIAPRGGRCCIDARHAFRCDRGRQPRARLPGQRGVESRLHPPPACRAP